MRLSAVTAVPSLVLSLAFFIASSASAATAPAPPAASGSQAQAAGLPRIGTRFVPGQTEPVSVPVDKRWEELLTSQQALFKRSWYDDMPEADEPPYPLEGPSSLFADIVKVQNAANISGNLYATVLVDETGKATQVSFHEIPNEALKDVLAFVLLKPAFKPAKCGGKPCAMEYPVTASFARREPAPVPVTPPVAGP